MDIEALSADDYNELSADTHTPPKPSPADLEPFTRKGSGTWGQQAVPACVQSTANRSAAPAVVPRLFRSARQRQRPQYPPPAFAPQRNGPPGTRTENPRRGQRGSAARLLSRRCHEPQGRSHVTVL
ncbi:hypothetical protein HDC93_007652 [Streptomyces sp. AK010]|nr:hypothetical protein [Streptomyces sp. AK010]